MANRSTRVETAVYRYDADDNEIEILLDVSLSGWDVDGVYLAGTSTPWEGELSEREEQDARELAQDELDARREDAYEAEREYLREECV